MDKMCTLFGVQITASLHRKSEKRAGMDRSKQCGGYPAIEGGGILSPLRPDGAVAVDSFGGIAGVTAGNIPRTGDGRKCIALQGE